MQRFPQEPWEDVLKNQSPVFKVKGNEADKVVELNSKQSYVKKKFRMRRSLISEAMFFIQFK